MNDKHFGIFRDCNRFIFILMSCQFRPKNKKKHSLSHYCQKTTRLLLAQTFIKHKTRTLTKLSINGSTKLTVMNPIETLEFTRVLLNLYLYFELEPEQSWIFDLVLTC